MFRLKGNFTKKEIFAAPGKKLSRNAKNALMEAAVRRREADPHCIKAGDCPQGGLEPTRYGDWSSSGRCTDF